MSWFLLGGDLYTAYTFVAVPALLFGAGAIGFFAVPYTIVVYPLVLLPAARLWSVAHKKGYVTAADFVRGRHGSPFLSALTAVTGVVATMPYIALQLIGIKAVVETMGISGDWPLWIAFVALAAYTYNSGLRAPALIAFIKDALIYIVVLVAVIYIPWKLSGYGNVFHLAHNALVAKKADVVLNHSQYLGFSTLALGSAMALFLYPHAVTGTLAARSRATVTRTISLLPAYSLMLGFLALTGYMALAAHVKPVGGTAKTPDANTVVPVLFHDMFPRWFAGVAFGAIAIGALVPAAIMAISAANTFTRDIYVPYLRPRASAAEEARVSKITSVVIKLGALGVIIGLNLQFALDFQLIGGVVIIEILPAVVLGMYTLWFHRWALVGGWLAGMGLSIYMLYITHSPTVHHFASASFALSSWGFDTKVTIWTGIVGLAANLVVSTVLTPVFRMLQAPAGRTAIDEADFESETALPLQVV